MVIELQQRGHCVAVQPSYPVYFRQQLIGTLIPDLVVDDVVIVDPKVAASFAETHVAQMIGYLNITGLELALLLNFKNARLDLEAGCPPPSHRSSPGFSLMRLLSA